MLNQDKLVKRFRKNLSEQDICIQFILRATQKASWDIEKQVCQEFSFTNLFSEINQKLTIIFYYGIKGD
jgi:hypothetical protein